MLIGKYNAKYIGKTMCGFINSCDYIIKIEKDRYGYIVEGIMNLTENKTNIDAYTTYASENSVRKDWDIKEDITEL